jgi:hypothetical protein
LRFRRKESGQRERGKIFCCGEKKGVSPKIHSFCGEASSKSKTRSRMRDAVFAGST